MRICVCYPPRAYPYIPYLAPYLLKGFVQTQSHHTVFAHDLNIEYHCSLWSHEFGTEASRELAGVGNRSGALVAELLARCGYESWKALRYPHTFSQVEEVKRHYLLLNEAPKLASALDRLRGADGLLPAAIGGWRELINRAENSTVGSFLQKRIASGIYDNFDALGISLSYVPQMLPGLVLARLLKKRLPSIKILVGGNAVTHYLEEVLTDLSFWEHLDAAIPFEGEISFLQALDCYESGQPLPETNLIQLQDGQIRYQKDLVSRPRAEAIPDFSDLSHLYPTPSPIYPLLTSKGCYWGKCAYCTHHEGYGEGFKRLGDDVVTRTVETLLEAGARHFYFVDEALPPRALNQIADILRRRGSDNEAKNPPLWMAEARMEKVMNTPPAVGLLKDSGCRLLVSGVESGSQAVLDLMKKGIDLKKVAGFARDCQKTGINVGWMFFIGFPGETAEQARQTFEFISQNVEFVDYVSIGTFKMGRGSPLTEDLSAYGIRELVDSGKPYPVTYDYLLEDGRLMDDDCHTESLKKLRDEYPQLRQVLDNGIDRALVMFMPPKNADRVEPHRSAGRDISFSWRSEITNSRVRLDVVKARLEVLHNHLSNEAGTYRHPSSCDCLNDRVLTDSSSD